MDETTTIIPTSDRASDIPLEGQNKRATKNAISVDLEAYMPLLDDPAISDADKLELLEALYAIMASFVDLGFSVISKPCGKSEEVSFGTINPLQEHIYSTHQNISEPSRAEAQVSCVEDEGVES